MGIKNTYIWQLAKKQRNKSLARKNYIKAKNMPLCQYEDYLIERTFEMMHRKAYFRDHAYRINFDDPKTFTEKRQWLKLYNQDPRKATYTDKYLVRKHIIETIGEEYLMPLITIDGKDYFESAKEIDFNKLPNSFVIKCSHGSHMNIVVQDKTKLKKKDIRQYKRQLNKWLHTNYAYVVAAELQYKDLKPRIIIEKYIKTDNTYLTDYKFFCFHGEPKFLGVFEGRSTTDYSETYRDIDFNKLDFRLDHFKENPKLKKPKNYDKMIEIVKKLCEDYAMVRVDLYNIDGSILFGELTFSSASGYDFPNPYEYDQILGDWIKIDNKIREENHTYRK